VFGLEPACRITDTAHCHNRFANNNVKLDIIAGTSIGGVNAAIIAGSKDDMNPEKQYLNPLE
jgi:patatin-like phospholipase/acyl hydrolase